MTAHGRFEMTGKNPIKDLAQFSPLKTGKPFSKEEFIAFGKAYPELQIERKQNGKLIIMSPVKFGSGNRESIVNGYLFIWWIKNKLGKTLSPSTGIDLPDGSTRSPDCGWVSDERLKQLTPEELEGEYLKVVPEFIVEVRSKSDYISELKKKMTHSWIKNGVQLGWLIDPYKEKVYIYRAGKEVEIVEEFSGKKLSGEKVLPGMELPLEELKISKK